MSQSLDITVTPEQIAFFHENGFLKIDRITTDEEIAWLRGIYDRLFSERNREDQGKYFDLGSRGSDGNDVLPQVLGPEDVVPELNDTIYFRNARRIVAALLGEDEAVINGGGHMILKPPRYGSETPWHQDEAYWPSTSVARAASAWMPLDPATAESGCLHFIPGSHKGPVLWHRHIDNDPLVHGLVTDDADPSSAVAVPLEAGGATFHHARTLHYAGPNTTDRTRRAYILSMNAPGIPLETPEHRPWQQEERDARIAAGLPVPE